MTWQDTTLIAAQVAGLAQLGYPNIPVQQGLRSLLIDKFRSSAHIAEAKKRLATARFNTEGNKTFEAFAAEIDADLIIIGMPYDDDNHITCSARADTLFKTLPQWLETRIKERGSPCAHEQWCFGMVIKSARTILSAQQTRTETRNQNSSSSSKPTTGTYRREGFNPRGGFRGGRGNYNNNPTWRNNFKKEENKDDWKKTKTCFNCGKRGHIAPDCRSTHTISGEKITKKEETKGTSKSMTTEEETDPRDISQLYVIEEKYGRGYRKLNEQEQITLINWNMVQTRCPFCDQRIYCAEHMCNCSTTHLILDESKVEDFLTIKKKDRRIKPQLRRRQMPPMNNRPYHGKNPHPYANNTREIYNIF